MQTDSSVTELVYLDNNSTTQPSARVVATIAACQRSCYFNASSLAASFTGSDQRGRDARRALARLTNAPSPECFVFTSGATESNNWVMLALAHPPRGRNVVVSSVEHLSVFEPAFALQRRGFEFRVLSVDRHGRVGQKELLRCLDKNTICVSVMAANHETGVLQSIGAIGALVRERCPLALFHTDATQAVGKIPIDVQGDWKDVDLFSFSAHKFHGPKGVGGLYLRPGTALEPLFRGGDQERGLRAGTTNVPGLAGVAVAATEVDGVELGDVRRLRDRFEAELLQEFPEAVVHSAGRARLPNTTCVSIPGTPAAALVRQLAAMGILVGTGAACCSGGTNATRTLAAMGVDEAMAQSSIRVSFSKFSSWSDAEILIDTLSRLVPRLRRGLLDATMRRATKVSCRPLLKGCAMSLASRCK